MKPVFFDGWISWAQGVRWSMGKLNGILTFSCSSLHFCLKFFCWYVSSISFPHTNLTNDIFCSCRHFGSSRDHHQEEAKPQGQGDASRQGIFAPHHRDYNSSCSLFIPKNAELTGVNRSKATRVCTCFFWLCLTNYRRILRLLDSW